MDGPKFVAGDIVYHEGSDTHLICSCAYLQDTNCMGKKRPEPCWDYNFYPLGGGDMCPMPIDGDEEPSECETCRKKELSLENLELFLRTGASEQQIENAIRGE